jgi:hypothetical protein
MSSRGCPRHPEADAAIERTGATGQRSSLLPARMMVYDFSRSAKFSSWSYEEVMRSLLSEIGMDQRPIQGMEDAVVLSNTAFTMSSPRIHATALRPLCASGKLRNVKHHEN